MEDINIPIFAQAKIEYTNQLIDIIYPHIYDGVKSIYDESKFLFSKKRSIPINLIFRELLEKVPIWSVEIVDSECNRIINNSTCDWIDDLITAVFISHTKILTSIGPNQTFQKINVTIPKTSNFIHKSYINIARELWKNPYLFNENIPGYEYQKNCKEIETIIKQNIEKTIRYLLPIKEILKEHLETYDNDATKSKEEIKKMLKDELGELKELLHKNKKKLKESVEEEDNNDEVEDNNDEVEENNDEGEENDEEGEKDLDSIVKENKEDKEVMDLLNELKEEKENVLKDQEYLSNPSNPSISNNAYYSNEYDDPSDEQINNQCKDIVVNDITIPVDEEINNDPEQVYDNVDFMNNKEELDKEKISRMKDIFEMKEETNKADTSQDDNILKQNDDYIINKSEVFTNEPDVNVLEPAVINGPEIKVLKYDEGQTNNESEVKVLEPANNEPEVLVLKKTEVEKVDDNIVQKEIEIKKSEESEESKVPSYSFTNTYSNMYNDTEKKVESRSVKEENDKDKEKDNSVKEEEDVLTELKSPKEIVKIENDLEETSTLVNFFQDIKQIAEDKGIEVNQNKDSFTLFDDASEV